MAGMLPIVDMARVEGAGVGVFSRKELGDVVRAARVRAGLTQQGLADRAGVSRQWVVQLERGMVNPSWDVVSRLAQVLDLDVVVRDSCAGTGDATAAVAEPGAVVDLDALLAGHRDRDGSPASGRGGL
jgi:HTH-type transcriptional regulator/antitoxin HipB